MTDHEHVGASISVVVATFNRAALLPALARALWAQERVGPYELVFVDNASTDETASTLAALTADSPVPMRVLRTSVNSGSPAPARNLGWRATTAPLVAFTDDDCVPSADWLAEIVAAFAQADVVQGRTESDPIETPGGGPFLRTTIVTEFSWKFETCNVAYRRELLERLGGFGERFDRVYGEDVDLGWRAMELGARPLWAPDAVVFHAVEKSGRHVEDWRAWIRYTRRCELVALTVKLHPGLRDHMFGRYFYKPYHAAALAAAAGLACTGAAPAAAAALATPWVYYRTFVMPRPAPRKWLWAVLPMAFVVDAAEVAWTAKGAIRYRRLVL